MKLKTLFLEFWEMYMSRSKVRARNLTFDQNTLVKSEYCSQF